MERRAGPPRPTVGVADFHCMTSWKPVKLGVLPVLRTLALKASFNMPVRDIRYFSVNAPPGSVPELVNGTNGGLSACT